MPINHGLQLPAELLGRKMCGLLPTLPDISGDQMHDALEHKQEHMKLNHDNKISDRSEPEVLPIGTQVMVQREDTGPWTHDTIINHNKAKHNMRSYRIKPSWQAMWWLGILNTSERQSLNLGCINVLRNLNRLTMTMARTKLTITLLTKPCLITKQFLLLPRP